MKHSMLILYYHYYNQQALRLKALREKDGMTIFLHQVDQVESYSTLKSIVDNYHTKENIKYLCLIGNEEEIPSYKTNFENQAMSDLHYGLNGISFNIYVGRITSGDTCYLKREISQQDRNEYVSNQIDKLEEYQSDLDNPRPWKSNVIGIGSEDGAGIGYQKMDDLTFVKKQLDNYYNNGCNTICISSGESLKKCLLKDGASCVFYVGHGLEDRVNTSDRITDVRSLENTHMYSFFVFVACLVGSHDEPDICLAEALQICKNGGTICACASTIEQSWRPPMYALTKMNNKINNKMRQPDLELTCGEIFYTGVEAILKGGIYNDRQTAETWTLLGDPSTQISIHPNSEKNSKNYSSNSNNIVNVDTQKILNIVLVSGLIFLTFRFLFKWFN